MYEAASTAIKLRELGEKLLVGSTRGQESSGGSGSPGSGVDSSSGSLSVITERIQVYVLLPTLSLSLSYSLCDVKDQKILERSA